jgi:hypothetical protein
MIPRTRHRPGWDVLPVGWGYAVAFKKPRSGRLVWVYTKAKDVVEASRIADKRRPDGYTEYGHSKWYWSDWGGYKEIITQAEYDDAPRRLAFARSQGWRPYVEETVAAELAKGTT